MQAERVGSGGAVGSQSNGRNLRDKRGIGFLKWTGERGMSE